ncbi:bifunctional diguanylate cyclase/phosphodiesterase [Thiocystis violacea]|uniref:Uncharacterized 76.5 kDa protein in phbC 3'region n=1 Tax=Thiocystis violacea TaxID=13725 RepID=YPH5_THIVI|nr:EAL domain-containing protein [Thiocystis violacea]P45365.1 RecName: Full=Uncharacterized 76.5 kDa protein in phbC 3'region; AltName: Full=ORF5 [Thiocystis violacea]AAB02863.1 OFR5 [Thiocystis violacea]AAC60431.1 orf5 3' to phbC [Thiocystis violacea]
MSNAATGSRVLYLGSDQGLMRDLTALVEPKSVQLVQLGSASALAQELRRLAPEVVILDAAAVSVEGGLAAFLGTLYGGEAFHPRAICIARAGSGEDRMEQRLAALRAGAASYLVPPISVKRLASRVLRMCGIVETVRYRILILEQDASHAKKIASLLATIGMETLVVDDPMKILARMQAFRPNLVLMDLYLPGATGSELTTIIRDHDDFYGIPILFLSQEADLDKQLAALKAGGDGFIKKPVSREALIAAVEYRMRMSRWLQDRRTLVNRRETAGGFLPRDVFMRHLEQITRAREAQGGVHGLVIIDVDGSQGILNALGLTATEKLLRELESLLSKTMTPEESATRMDDFRYGLLAKRETLSKLEALASTLCQQLSGLKPQDRDIKLEVSVSVGVGLFDPPADDAFAMVSRAEKAAAGAKSAGGNQAHVWSAASRQNGAPEAESVIKRLVSTALAQDGFLLFFQPILSLNQQEDELYEAQIRMKTLDGEQMPPAEFLSVAERAEMMPRIDRWVLRRAFEVMHAERVAHPRLRLLVHQNVMTLAAPEWFPWFRDQIIKRNLTQIYPVLELQMADVRQNRAEAKVFIERLRKYGIQVCVANVTGIREEISLLARIGATLAKLAFQTIRNADRIQLTEIVQALQARGVAVIAAGIDDQATVSRVWTCRPDFIQGNYLQLPQPELSFDFQHMSHDG